MNSIFDQGEIFSAYRKLKHLVYYDNVSLFLRERLAEFEFDKFIRLEGQEKIILPSPEQRRKAFAEVYKLLDGKFADLNDQISFRLVPKKVNKQESNDKDSLPFLSNKLYSENGIVKRGDFNILIDASIPIHIISILWIMKIAPFIKDEYGCWYANILYPHIHTGEEDDEIHDDALSLFIPYYKTYQQWRDKALDKVKSLMDENRNATLLSLDIHKYFYNINISVEKATSEILPEDVALSEEITKIKKLAQILDKVHFIYCQKVKKFLRENEIDITESKRFLPIGLYSSGVLANLFLKEFDKGVVEIINPAYYGRYVDDMLMVFSDRILEGDDSVKNFIKKYLSGIFEFESPGKSSANSETLLVRKEFFPSECDQLMIQQDKLMLEYFYHDETHALIDNFKLKIDRQRSEFRFLPDEDIIDKEFDHTAFKIGYSGSIQKIRSISDFKSDRFSVSAYLAKAITLALYDYGRPIKDKSGTDDAKTAIQIRSFFKGSQCLDFWQMWEKVCSWFVIAGMIPQLEKFLAATRKSVKNLELKDGESHTDFSKKFKGDMLHYLDCALAMALSLSGSSIRRQLTAKRHQVEVMAKNFRYSNMSRHHFIGCPGINFTQLLFEPQLNLYDFGKGSREVAHLNLSLTTVLTVIRFLAKLSPRCVRYHEISLLYSLSRCGTPESEHRLGELWNYFHSFRNHKEGYQHPCPNVRMNKYQDRYMFVDVYDYMDATEETGANKRIAVANLKGDDSEFSQILKGYPEFSIKRRTAIFHVINEAVAEKCDMIVFPELSVPFAWASRLANYSVKSGIAIVAGLQYKIDNGLAYNVVATFLPFKTRYYSDCFPYLRTKRHYAPLEKENIRIHLLEEPSAAMKEPVALFHWRKVYFPVYNCFEMADIKLRAAFQGLSDFIVAIEYNADLNYYQQLIHSWSRDMHCYVVQCNISHYGDSRIIAPKKTDSSVILQIKGGENTTLLTGDLDIDDIRDFQMRDFDKDDKRYKPLPPEFDSPKREKVRHRIENKSLESIIQEAQPKKVSDRNKHKHLNAYVVENTHRQVINIHY